jgi:hypothetical protein
MWLGILIGFILATGTCVIYGQYVIKSILRDNTITARRVETLNGDKWIAHIPNESPNEIADSEEAAVGKLYIRLIKLAKERYKI